MALVLFTISNYFLALALELLSEGVTYFFNQFYIAQVYLLQSFIIIHPCKRIQATQTERIWDKRQK